MERITGGVVGATQLDNLVDKLYPPTDTFLVELKTPGAYKRGTVMSRESDGSYELLGKGTGKASVVIAEETREGDGTAIAYRSGHFNRLALTVKEGYELTGADENDLRGAGILLSDMAYTPVEDETAGGESGEQDKTYTEEELNALTVTEIKALADGKGYTITKTAKADIIAEFLAAQSA